MNAGTILLLLAVSSSQMDDEFYHDLSGGDLPPALKPFGPDATGVMRREPRGLRIALPADREDPAAVGLSPAFTVSGDFEITVTYEILKADASPTGVGVNVGVIVGSPMREAARLCRYLRAKEGHVYSVNRVSAVPGDEPRREMTSFPTEATAGQLRLKRTGSRLHFLVAEGSSGEFRELCDGDFVAEDVLVRFAAHTGKGPALDARLVDLRIRAERLPMAAPSKRGSHGWWIWLIVGVVATGFVLAAVRWWQWRASQ